MSISEMTVATDTPEQADFRAEVRAFLAANGKPRTQSSPWAIHFRTDPAESSRDFHNGVAWQRLRFDNKLAGLTYPVELGGRGGQPWHESIYNEEAATYSNTSGFINSTIAMLGPTLMKFGTDEQKQKYVPRLLSGDDAYCQLFSEPGAGSDLAGLACRAVRDGDEFIINGQKVWNSAAQFCDRGFLLVRTDPDVPKHRGITFILVDMKAPGIEVRPLVQPTGGQEFNEVFFNDVRVPVANVLGEVNGGWALARTVMSNESAMIGGGSPGMSVHDKMVMLAKHFGVTNDPLVRQGLADYYIRERLLAMMGERIMGAVRKREMPPMDPSILKLFVAVNKVISGNLAAQIAGAAALVNDDEIGRWIGTELMNRYSISIGGGTNEVQRNNLAERALGLPKEPSDDRTRAWKDIPRS
jgi:alkylation response protein AidB-like acyl-CoA dehydrogenase